LPLRAQKSALKLRAQPRPDYRHRTAIAIVGRIDDELIVGRDPPVADRKAVIRFQDLLDAGMRQPAVADQDAEPAGIEVGLMRARNSVDSTGDRERVVGPAPPLPRNRRPDRHRAVDVGELVRFEIAVRKAGAREYADAVSNLLPEVHVHAAAA